MSDHPQRSRPIPLPWRHAAQASARRVFRAPVFHRRVAPILFLGCLLCFLLQGFPVLGRESPSVPPRYDRAMEAYEDGYRAYRKGEFPEAERHFRQALEAEPNLIKAHYWLGKVYREMGMLVESVFHWEEVLRLSKLIRDRRLALSLQNNEYPAEQQILATKRREAEAREAFASGKSLLDQGHWEGAIVETKRAVALYPGNQEFLQFLARLLWDQNDLEGCANACIQLLNLPRVDRKPSLDAVDRLVFLGHPEAARRGLRALQGRFPGDAEIGRRLAALETGLPEGVSAPGRVLEVKRGQAVVDLGMDDGLKLADEYNLELRAFRPGHPVTDPESAKVLGRMPDTTTGNLLVTKVFAKSSWALIRQEFGTGVKAGDLVEHKGTFR